MFECIGILFFLAVSMGIVWLAFLIGELKQTTVNLSGEIKMKQKEFETQVDGLIGKVDALNTKSDAESVQVNALVQGYKEEIERLRTENPQLDTSRLDALNNRLDEAATRIGAIVPDEPTQADAPAETVDPLPSKADQIPDTQTVPAETIDEQPAPIEELVAPQAAEFPADETATSSESSTTETTTTTETTESESAESAASPTESVEAENTSDDEPKK